jgi:hypothetical protein
VKRQAIAGSHRGPVAPTRQRRTIRFVQITLVLIALGLVAFGAYSVAERTISQAVSLILVGVVAAGGAFLLSDGPSVRVPTPARLDELAGRAEKVAIDKIGD